VRWLPHTNDSAWLYDRMSGLLQQLNERFWRFELTDLEPLQLARYPVGGAYDWHVDLGPGRASLRKLSVSIQLSPPDTYDGGDLEFPDVVGPVTRAQGSAIVFPSHLRHRVTAVTRGERWSVVGWFVGPPFR
jgi:PKHD-type hydroxylase